MSPEELHSQSDYRGMRLLPGKTVSIFFHDQHHYPCPECKGELDRAQIHGWYWSCARCKKTFPKYVLEEFIPKEEPKGFMGRMREVFHGK